MDMIGSHGRYDIIGYKLDWMMFFGTFSFVRCKNMIRQEQVRVSTDLDESQFDTMCYCVSLLDLKQNQNIQAVKSLQSETETWSKTK